MIVMRNLRIGEQNKEILSIEEVIAEKEDDPEARAEKGDQSAEVENEIAAVKEGLEAGVEKEGKIEEELVGVDRGVERGDPMAAVDTEARKGLEVDIIETLEAGVEVEGGEERTR